MKKKNLIRLQDITFGTIAVSSLFLLLGASGANATTSAVDEVTITVPASCSLTNTIGSAHTATIETGVYQDDIGETTFKVFCNDNEGFAVYAVGYTNDSFGNNTLKPTDLASSYAIATGTATSGGTSNWAMKLTAVSGDYAPTLETGFNDYHIIPDTYTKVASYASNTDSSTGSSFKSTYGAFISQTQPADSYTGKVKYTVVHPANADVPLVDMQNLPASQCTTTPSQVTDIRDGHVYTIQRLLDGNCWMMENLDLGRRDLTTDLTSANTNLSTTITASTFNGWKTILNTNVYTPSEWQTYNAGIFIPLTTSNTTNGLDTDPVSGNPYGTLYNYYVASAGTITGNVNYNDAQYDICPAGWRLPTGGYNAGEIQTLYSQYSSPALMRASIADSGAAFALAGHTTSGGGQSYVGGYWTSTADNDTTMNYLFISDESIGVGYIFNRYVGISVRCVLNDATKIKTISDLTYMQELKSLSENDKASVLASMTEDQQYQLKDYRDNKTYYVSKLKDGKVWMTQNLDLNLNSNRTYTHVDTDLGWGTDTATMSWTPTNSTIDATAVTNNSISGWSDNTNTPDSVDPGNYYWTDTWYESTSNIFLNNDLGSNPERWKRNESFAGNGAHGHVGNYYSWSAAVAMNDTSSYTTDTLNNATANPQNSICPAGWRLPIITSYNTNETGDNDFWNLFYYYNDKKTDTDTGLVSSPLYFIRGGYARSGQDAAGIGANYWSSTVNDSFNAYRLCFSSRGVDNLISYGSRYNGQSVRCVAR